ncbi:hypothetical protein EVAR_91872_1 [Eumeta japonica]|uniref:Uncharacterized protein n=1 Tax=Eumeta variegata TaxID=151549 RepID=A0A4C1TIJ1_EUMVA|nr:hypothetical protein EVAR_91872_1 [Eumeta japonica]
MHMQIDDAAAIVNSLRFEQTISDGVGYRLVCSPPGVRAFVLPLTLLVPGLSCGGAALRVTRLHAISYQVSWIQLYATLVAIGVLLFCLLLELRRRR